MIQIVDHAREKGLSGQPVTVLLPTWLAKVQNLAAADVEVATQIADRVPTLLGAPRVVGKDGIAMLDAGISLAANPSLEDISRIVSGLDKAARDAGHASREISAIISLLQTTAVSNLPQFKGLRNALLVLQDEAARGQEHLTNASSSLSMGKSALALLMRLT